jgi:hypothetical protein
MDDPFAMATYTNSLRRFMKFHAPFDKLSAHILDKLDTVPN